VAGGTLRVAFGFTIGAGGRVARIDLIADPGVLRSLSIER